jgi:hypothetical protein
MIMEKLKPLSEIRDPDERNLMFVRIDTGEPLSIEEHHANISSVVLSSAIPEEVRSYFATVQNVCVYAWFAYDLYTVVQFLCFTTVEMALRIRLGSTSHRPGLASLLQEAVSKKLIKQKAFSHVREMRRDAAERIRLDRHILRQTGTWPVASASQADYTKILAKSLPWLRNAFAHPQRHTIITPGQALFQLRITGELINQLFAP